VDYRREADVQRRKCSSWIGWRVFPGERPERCEAEAHRSESEAKRIKLVAIFAAVCPLPWRLATMKLHQFTTACAVLGAMTAAERSKGRYMRAPDHGALDRWSTDKTPEELAAEVKEHLDGKFREVDARLHDVEQKAVRRPGSESFLPSAGHQFVENDEVKSFTGNAVTAGRRISVETKAIISSLTTDADGSAGGMVVPYRDQVVDLPRRRLVIRDLLSVVPITSGSVQYPKVTGYTNSAATVSETAGTTKPQSELKIALETATVTTIAHFVEAMRQILDDAPQLAGLIDGELRYGLAYAEELQLLSGGGTGSDLNGIYTQATAWTANVAIIQNPTKIDAIAMAILQQNLTNYPADGIVINPADWTSMQVIKDANDNYVLGDPQGTTQPRLFGLPVVVTPAMAADKFLVGCFQQGATLYDRMAARVEVSTEDSDNFRKNKVTILAEERVALAVKNTLAFTKGDFSDAIEDLTS
jgi:HK97 family phage major capsid protein